MNPLSLSPSRWVGLTLAVFSGLSINANAHGPDHSQRPDPLDSTAVVPKTIYVSPFQSYRPFADQEVGSWTETNATTARVGGWKVYAKQAREPDTKDVNPPLPSKNNSTTDKPQPMNNMEHKK